MFMSKNVGEIVINEIRDLWNGHSTHHPYMCLHLPSFVGLSSSASFQELKSKFWRKFCKMEIARHLEKFLCIYYLMEFALSVICKLKIVGMYYLSVQLLSADMGILM